MSLVIFNGSPRGNSSNSAYIAKWFSDAYASGEVSVYPLNLAKNMPQNVAHFQSATEIMMVFPLYVDGMPGQVKAFLEALMTVKSHLNGKKITYIIHSGFSEGIQSRSLESYLGRVTDLLSLDSSGVIIIPGSEGFRLMPPFMTRKKHQAVKNLALAFKSNRPYTDKDLKILNPHERLSGLRKIMFQLMTKIGLINTYWNHQLKSNGAYKQRFDAPYTREPIPVNAPWHISNY